MHKAVDVDLDRAKCDLLNLLVVLLVVGVVTAGALVHFDHLQLEPVLSGSMRPAAQPGDLIVAQQTPTSALRVGEVVAFYPPDSPGAPVMHRIVRLTRRGGITTITTKGDANNRVDPWGQIKLVSSSSYRMVDVVPKVGFASVWIHRIESSRRGLLMILAGGLLLAMGPRLLRGTRSNTKGHTGGRKLEQGTEQ